MYPLAVRNILTRGILSSIILLCIIIIYIIFVKYFIKIINKNNFVDDESIFGFFVVIGSLIMPIIIYALYTSLIRVINYEWYAVQEMIRIIGGG